MRRVVARIDVAAVRHNASVLAAALGETSSLCAVVKADAYGHGAVDSARAALAGGARMLAVATALEAAELRGELHDAPILVMGALSLEELDAALGADSELALWREEFLEPVARRADELGLRPRIHVKHDSGMGRLGARDEETVLRVCERVAADDRLELAGLWTHFATADEHDDEFFGLQLDRFGAVVERARAMHEGLLVHAANSAATLRDPASHFDMARCGVALYGLDPFGVDPADHGLKPAMQLCSWVADLKTFEPGASAGYGRRWAAASETRVGVLPIGYGDGWRRGLTNSADVLIGGRRYPLVGAVSMDNVTVDLGIDGAVEQGAEVVLIGADGDERVLAEELAAALGTINYEITCGISARVPREYVGSA